MKEMKSKVNYLYLICMSVCLMGSNGNGKLPEGFTFGAPSDKERIPFITQWKIYEECKGDLECILKIRELQQSMKLNNHTSTEVNIVSGNSITNIVQENHVSQRSNR